MLSKGGHHKYLRHGLANLLVYCLATCVTHKARVKLAQDLCSCAGHGLADSKHLLGGTAMLLHFWLCNHVMQLSYILMTPRAIDRLLLPVINQT